MYRTAPFIKGSYGRAYGWWLRKRVSITFHCMALHCIASHYVAGSYGRAYGWYLHKRYEESIGSMMAVTVTVEWQRDQRS